jgi:hypothetical protein
MIEIKETNVIMPSQFVLQKDEGDAPWKEQRENKNL